MLKALALTFLLIGCVSQSRDLLEDCVARQVELYGDICSESSTGYESMNGREAHFEGVKCATDAVLWCIDAN